MRYLEKWLNKKKKLKVVQQIGKMWLWLLLKEAQDTCMYIGITYYVYICKYELRD